ncbi:polysaccharide deacetylase family protein [Malikia sp.]|uniref:polysaccharide deacetylase family protein n=1 Tax=Malikia sp. TaxID=2070706 RepID=UPI00260A1E1A|nr:polysaccharide deacetylase family protein [Malikia sp.]MDD2728593.1 polysaccharide deacetylase family protein [Malikia sp.]
MTKVFLAAQALRILGTLHDWLFGTSFRVLCYHTISNAQRFSQHLAVLNISAEVLGLGQLLTQKDKRYSLSTKPRVLITFDDGDPSVLDRAAPVLASHGMPSALFVVTDWVTSETEPWWVTSSRAWQHNSNLEIHGERFSSNQALIARLKTLPDTDRKAFVSEHFSAARPARNPEWSELSAAMKQGMEIGAHSASHPCLDMCSPEQVQREVSSSIATVQKRLGLAQVAFALPNGNGNPDALQAAADFQASSVLLFDHRTMPASRLNVSMPLISRLRIDDYASVWRFVFIASGWHSRIYHLIRRDTQSRTL